MADFINPLLIHGTIQAATPLILAALAGALCGQVGIFNMALEGQMLIGAFASVAGSYFFRSAAAGVMCGVGATLAFSTILAVGGAWLKGNVVVVCVALNLFASGLTAYLLNVLFGVSGTFSDPNIQGLDRIEIPALDANDYLSAFLGDQTLITYASWILVVLCAIALYRTPWGLRLRGVGEAESAASSFGASVLRYRMWTVTLTGGLVGLAGAQLALGSVDVFSEDMSAGRGWIAMVAVMLARGNPVHAAGACLLFGAADALGFRLQSWGLPNQITSIAPYVVTLCALCLARTRPRSLAH